MLSKKLSLAIIILIIILGGTFWWFNTHASINKATTNLGQLKTSNYNLHLVINNTAATQQLLKENGTIDITLAGAFDRSKNPTDLRGDLDLLVKTNSVSMQLDGELRMIKDKLYIIVDNAPSAIPLLSQLKGQWIELPRNVAKNNAPEPKVGKELLSKITRVGNESINKENTVHYRAVATSDAMIAMTTSMAQVIGTQLTSAQVEQIKEGVAKTGEVSIDLWVTPWTNQVRRMSSSIQVPNANTINFELTLTNANQPANITAPKGAVTLPQAAQNAQLKTTPTPVR